MRPGNVVQPIPIASTAWASLLPTVGEAVLAANRTTRPCHGGAERRRVERLDRVGPDARVRVVDEPAQDPALGAERVRHERVGRDREAALLVDLGDRRPQGADRPDALGR